MVPVRLVAALRCWLRIVNLVRNAGQVKKKKFHFSGGLVDARSGGSKPGKTILVPGWLVQSN